MSSNTHVGTAASTSAVVVPTGGELLKSSPFETIDTIIDTV